MSWMIKLAEEIRSNWLEWEQEAAEVSTVDQDSRSGEQLLFERLLTAIRKASEPLRKTAAHVPAKIWMKATEDAGYPVQIKAN